jgi:hypothetical protein
VRDALDRGRAGPDDPDALAGEPGEVPIRVAAGVAVVPPARSRVNPGLDVRVIDVVRELGHNVDLLVVVAIGPQALVALLAVLLPEPSGSKPGTPKTSMMRLLVPVTGSL